MATRTATEDRLEIAPSDPGNTKPQVTASESWGFAEPLSGFEPETYALRARQDWAPGRIALHQMALLRRSEW